jgi:uncharacterized protein (UPF0210 family)
MKIRSITYFDNLQWPLDKERLREAGEFIKKAKDAFQEAGFEIQTTRLATPPFGLILGDRLWDEISNYATSLEEELIGRGFDFISIGPALPDIPESYSVLTQVLGDTENVFTAGIVTSAQHGIDLAAIKACAQVIKNCAGISPDGFTNLRFAALANVPPGSPFFPAAYHLYGENPAFSIATEAADLAVSAFENTIELDDGRQKLVQSVETLAKTITRIGKDLTEQTKIKFAGIDFSLAPFPRPEQSIGTAIEQLGGGPFGAPGTLAAVGILADALAQAQFEKVGFNGIMLPIMEDSVLAQRVAEDQTAVSDLLLFSAVCGTGLDTIPLPGDVSIEQLYATLLDLGVLSQRLNKPLTARLMPIPGKEAGTLTEFDFEYFANTRIMDIGDHPLAGVLAGDESFMVRTIKP